MTLIVGRVRNKKVYIFGDTELTFYYKNRTNPFVEGCLKEYIVTENIAIAFAGVREHFEDVLHQMLKCRESLEIVKIALDTQSRGMDYHLLIGEAGYNGIRVIKDGKLHEVEAGFIGNSEAYSAFQKYYHTVSDSTISESETGRAAIQFLRLPEPILEDEIYYRMYWSFKQVIRDSGIAGVGGVIVPLCTDGGNFRYMNYADVVSDILSPEDFSDEPRPITFGTTAGGGYSVEFCDDIPHGGFGREVGYYFLQGGFGIIFPANEKGFRNAEVVKAKSPAYWVLNTRKRLGHAIASQYLTEDHCGIAGEELLKSHNYVDALFCYELGKSSKSLKDRPAIRDRYMAGYATALFNSGRKSEAINVLQSEIKENTNNLCCEKILNKMLNK